nr:hypothetical protein [Halobacillus sp. Marseille-P3879]
MGDFPHLYPAGKATFKDSGVTKAHELLVPWKGFGILGAPLSNPSISHSGASSAPGAIRSAFSSYTTYAIEDKSVDMDVLDQAFAPGDREAWTVKHFCKRLHFLEAKKW